MRKLKLKRRTKGQILKVCALIIDVGVPLGVTLSYFPVWIDRSTTSTVSGLSLVLALVCCIPFYKKILEYFKKSPSVCVLWTILFVLFLALESIVCEIKIICFFGMVANYIGAVLYKIGTNMTRPKQADEDE